MSLSAYRREHANWLSAIDYWLFAKRGYWLLRTVRLDHSLRSAIIPGIVALGYRPLAIGHARSARPRSSTDRTEVS